MFSMYDAYECALNMGVPVWDVAWSLAEWDAQRAAESATRMKARFIDPAETDALDNAIKANIAVVEIARRKQQAIDEFTQQLRADHPSTLREKTDDNRRSFFSSILCRWFHRRLKNPTYELATDLANLAFPNDAPTTRDAVKMAYHRRYPKVTT
jgi:hypothetical protein